MTKAKSRRGTVTERAALRAKSPCRRSADKSPKKITPRGGGKTSDETLPADVTSLLIQSDVDDLTTHIKDIQRLVRICVAAGGNGAEEFQWEITETLGNEVLNHLWEALEIAAKMAEARS